MGLFKRIIAIAAFSLGGLFLLLWFLRGLIEFIKRVIWAITIPDLGYALVAAVLLLFLLFPLWVLKKYFKWGKKLLAEMKAADARPNPNPPWLK